MNVKFSEMLRSGMALLLALCMAVGLLPATVFAAEVEDVNDDGVIDTKDLTRLARHLVGASVVINEKAANTNGDNTIDTKDLTRLARYLVGGANLG